MDKVYSVIEAYYFIDETHETVWGTYSTREKAQIRSDKVKQMANVNPNHIFIKDVPLDVDTAEPCIRG